MSRTDKLITVRRQPSEYRQDRPWVSRCRFVTCMGWTRYYRTHDAAIHGAAHHSHNHWPGVLAA